MPDELHVVEIQGTCGGEYRDNVLHFKIAGATNDTAFLNSNALVSYINATIKPLFLACIPPSYYMETIKARRITPTPGPYAMADQEPFMTPGTRGTAATGLQLCPCVTLIPPNGVKSAGKIFMPAVDKADVNLNVFAAGYQTVIATLINTLTAGSAVAGGLATLVIYSRKLHTSSAVAGFHLSPVIGYQRKRSRPIGV